MQNGEGTKTKVCYRCKRELPVTEFYVHGRDGAYHSWCKQCCCEDKKKKWQEKKKGLPQVYPNANGQLMKRTKGHPSIYWTANMLSLLRRHYAETENKEIADMLGISSKTVWRKAKELGLHKSEAFRKRIWQECIPLACIRAKQLGYPNSFKSRGEVWKGNCHTGRTLVAVITPNNRTE